MKKLLVKVLGIITLVSSISACTRILDTEVGVRQEFSGEIQDQVLTQGLYQVVVGDVVKFSTRNLVLNINTQPITLEKVPMQSFQVKVNYGIVPSNAAIAYKTEKAQHITTEDGDVYLLGQYVEYVTNSAVNDVISQYNALDVNNNRTKIEGQIKDVINTKLKAQGKDKFVKVNEINILKVSPPQSIVNSSLAIVNSENALKTKKNELAVAQVEQERMRVLAQSADKDYINLMNAQASVTTAEALKIAATKGTLNTIIVPKDFNSLGSVSK